MAGLTTGVGVSLDRLADEVTEAMEGATEEEPVDKPEPTMFEKMTDKVFPAPSGKKADLPNDGTHVARPLNVQEVQDDLPLASWASSAGSVFGPLATADLVSVFALFMLIHREDFRDRIIAVESHAIM